MADFDWALSFPSPARLMAGWSLLVVLESLLVIQEHVKLPNTDSRVQRAVPLIAADPTEQPYLG